MLQYFGVTDVIDPISFHAMRDYPCPSTETYPDDEDHP